MISAVAEIMAYVWRPGEAAGKWSLVYINGSGSVQHTLSTFLHSRQMPACYHDSSISTWLCPSHVQAQDISKLYNNEIQIEQRSVTETMFQDFPPFRNSSPPAVAFHYQGFR